MQILLFILKIILIILLALLGLFLLALALILFVPIRYEVEGKIADEFQFEAKGAIRYLLSAFKFTFSYWNGQLDSDIYLFGIRKKKKPDDEVEVSENVDETFVAEDIKASGEPGADEPTTDEVQSVQQESVAKEQTVQEQHISQLEEKPKAKHKKLKREKSKIDFALIKKELTDKHNHNVIKKFFAELKYLFRHFKFRKIKTDLVFSTGDPALTGQLLGVVSMFPTVYRYEFKIVPDFMADDPYLKGTFFVAGKVRLIHILMTTLRLIFDKEVRLVIKKFMAMMKQ